MNLLLRDVELTGLVGDLRGSDLRGGDTRGSDTRGSDTWASDARGGDTWASDARVGDVRVRDGVVAEIGVRLSPGPADEVVDGRRAALIPGLHDRHLHLLALAAAGRSVALGGLRTRDDLAAALGGATRTASGEWIRAVGYHESIAGPLDRWALDQLTGVRPARVQHRGGALWVLNSAALQRIRLDDTADVERDRDGEPNGRLWRYDGRLREQLDDGPGVDVDGPATLLARYGITAVTDATPDLDAAAAERLAALPQRVTLLGATAPAPAGTTLGPRKILLRDHDLPPLGELRRRVLAARAENRAVAVHCVTRVALLLTLAVLDDVGRWPGDRIEHAAVVPDPRLLDGLTVVTQPGFVADRGDDYRRDVEPDDLPHLYPFASLIAAGVRVHASSDAPFGPLDPWQVVRAARDRSTPSGAVLGPDERVSAGTALASYLSHPAIRVGMPADLCLLRAPLAAVLEQPHHSLVAAVWVGGHPVA